MKIIVNESSRGLLYKNGSYRKLLMPGKHRIAALLGESYQILPLDAEIGEEADVDVLLRDPEFAASVLVIEVPDGHVAVRFVDGRVTDVLSAGRYCYFNVYGKLSYRLFDISACEIDGLSAEQIGRMPTVCYQKIVVAEGETGLLFYDGRFVRALTAGAYYFWTGKVAVSCERVDLRAQELEINGQEILTADKVSLRVNFVCRYRIVDAVKLYGEVKNYKEQIYTVTQLALREYVGRYRFDELLEQKDTIAAVVLEHLKTEGEKYYIDFMSAGLKDIILPGEIRDIMNTVLIAEKNAQANVIARREEVASTRSLLNTAKLLDENATLYKLKELEYLERICDKVGSISVGGGDLLGELRKIMSGEK